MFIIRFLDSFTQKGINLEVNWKNRWPVKNSIMANEEDVELNYIDIELDKWMIKGM